MPISLRLPAEVESQIANYSARLGLSKSAVIVRSIEEFLAENAQPSAYQLYLDAMEAAQTTTAQSVKAKTPPEAPAGHKLAIQKALQRKHKDRSARATQALQRSARKAA
jgi:predicted DNA-binding protein